MPGGNLCCLPIGDLFRRAERAARSPTPANDPTTDIGRAAKLANDRLYTGRSDDGDSSPLVCSAVIVPIPVAQGPVHQWIRKGLARGEHAFKSKHEGLERSGRSTFTVFDRL
jgi:hypothetical protein